MITLALNKSQIRKCTSTLTLDDRLRGFMELRSRYVYRNVSRCIVLRVHANPLRSSFV